jgi:surface antigen
MIRPSALLLLVTSLALAGCDITSSDGGPGLGAGTLARAYSGTKSAIGLSDEDAATAVSNAALGGLVTSKLGAALTPEDRKLAFEAQMTALDVGAPGAPVPWRNPASGHYGNIVPGPLYDQKGTKCRGFSHTITVGGELKTARGTVCRGAEGGWTAAT